MWRRVGGIEVDWGLKGMGWMGVRLLVEGREGGREGGKGKGSGVWD